MKIALLVCDHVKPELQAYGDYPLMFKQLLPELPMDPWFVCDGDFPDVDQYDGFITTGSKSSVYEKLDWILKLQALTREIYSKQKKFVGVCFGHQLIAEALGGKVEKAAPGYLIGVHATKIDKKIPWLRDDHSSYNILMLCQDQVSQLPPNAIVYAGNHDCPIGMFSVGPHFMGVQGHPEFSNAYNEAVIKDRSDKIDGTRIADAIRSFEQEPDTNWLSNLIMQFLFQ
ncbi:MAG: GMP synthase-like glutamine amidotransferase [Cyclobacteriaceae bacterium]|jgi:GMP synthase-like glutamine amidotransferase